MLIWGFLVSLLGALAGYYKQALSASGLVGALLVGTVITGFGGWVWLAILAAFFLSASVLSGYRRRDKQGVEQDFAKTGRRDLGQVLANGGAGALVALINSLLGPDPHFFALFIGTMATVNADTWATELGVLSRGGTRSVLTGRRVAPGTSGGVSLAGTAAAAAGAALTGMVAEVGQLLTTPILPMSSVILVSLVSGLVGCFADSFLGATVQIQYQCQVCGKVTEKTEHCHKLSRPTRGWPWVNNDLVNLLSSLIGGGTAVLLVYLLTSLNSAIL
ncbi:MAG: DUF92 domain-containing protein [Bacillota bacterium]